MHGQQYIKILLSVNAPAYDKTEKSKDIPYEEMVKILIIFLKTTFKKILICKPSTLNTYNVVSLGAPNSILTLAPNWLRRSFRSFTVCSFIFRLSKFMIAYTDRVT